MNLQYSEISITGQLPEKREDVTEEHYKASVCAKALMDWGICMTGTRLPQKFGDGMVQVSKLLGVSANPQSLKEYANKLILSPN